MPVAPVAPPRARASLQPMVVEVVNDIVEGMPAPPPTIEAASTYPTATAPPPIVMPGSSMCKVMAYLPLDMLVIRDAKLIEEVLNFLIQPQYQWEKTSRPLVEVLFEIFPQLLSISWPLTCIICYLLTRVPN